jgi:hypothetical protein
MNMPYMALLTALESQNLEQDLCFILQGLTTYSH